MAQISSSEQQAAASIVKWLQTNGGMTLQGACGVAGNIKGESSFNPNAIGDHGTSGGICQWHNERFDRLRNYAVSKGAAWNTLESQLGFLMTELNSSSYASLLNTLKTTTNVVTASNQWGHDFEKFSGYNNYSTPEYGKRSSYAQAIYSGVTSGNWQATDIANVSVGGNSSGGTSGTVNNQQTKPNEARPIMASRGENKVYKLSSASNYSFAQAATTGRKEKFNKLKETFSNSAPELGRDIVLTDGSYPVEILKGQQAKTFRKSST